MDRLGSRTRWLFELLTYVAIIVPGIVIGIATLIFIVTAFDWLNPWIAYLTSSRGPEIGLGLGSVIAAHTLFTMAIVNVLVRTRMRGMDRTLIEASEDLFATPWRTFVQVTFPQLLPAIVAGGLLAFTFSFDDFIIAFFTAGQDQTRADLPVRIDPSRREPGGQRDRDGPAHSHDRRDGRRRPRLPPRSATVRWCGRSGWRHRRSRACRSRLLRSRRTVRPDGSSGCAAAPDRRRSRRAPSAPSITGGYEPGSKLPNEDALAERFGVSRATIREASRGLVEEGYLVRRQGSGTFVTARPLLRNSLDTNFSYTAYLESTGVRAGRRILGLREVPLTRSSRSSCGSRRGHGSSN